MKHIRVTTPVLIGLATITSLIANISILLNPNRLAFAGGDVFHNIWTYKRNWAYLTSFDSNFLNQIQYPTNGSAFMGELQLGNTLIFQLLNAFLKNDILVYGFMRFISGVIVFYSMFKIAKLLGVDESFGLIVATYAATAMYLANHISHLQVTSFFWLTIPIWQTLELAKSNVSFSVSRKVLLFFTTLFLLSGPSYLNIVLILCVAFSIFVSLIFAVTAPGTLLFSKKGIVFKVISYLQPTIKILISAILIAGLFWIPYLQQAIGNRNARSVSEISSFRVDLSQFINPASSNWLYGQHNFSSYVPSGDSLFPGIIVFLVILIGFGRTKMIIPSTQFYILCCGMLLIALSLSSPITLFGYAILPNPLFLVMSSMGVLSATRYLPTLAFFGVLLLLLAAVLKATTPSTWKKHRIWPISLVVCSLLVLENLPNNSLILPSQPRLSSNWASLAPELKTVEVDYVGIYPGPTLPLNPTDPLFWTQFEWMAGLAEVPLKFVGGNTGFFEPESLELMSIVQRQEVLKELPMKSCLITAKCLLIVDKIGLEQIKSPYQLLFLQNEAKSLGLPTRNFDQFLVIGLEN